MCSTCWRLSDYEIRCSPKFAARSVITVDFGEDKSVAHQSQVSVNNVQGHEALTDKYPSEKFSYCSLEVAVDIVVATCEHHGVSNHRQLDYMLRLSTRKTPALRITECLWVESTIEKVDFPHKGAVMRWALSCHGIMINWLHRSSIWWVIRHHAPIIIRRDVFEVKPRHKTVN